MCGNDVCNIEDDGDHFKSILYLLAVCVYVSMPAHVLEGWDMPWHAMVHVWRSEGTFWESVLSFRSFARQFWLFLPRDHVHWTSWPTSFLVSLCLHLPSRHGSELGIRMLAITSCFLCGSRGLNPDGQVLKASAFTAEPSFQPLGVCYMPSTVECFMCGPDNIPSGKDLSGSILQEVLKSYFIHTYT